VIALVLIIVFVGIVVYSAVQVVKSQPRVGASTAGFESNGTIGITTSFSLNNPTYFTIQQFGLQFRILNETGVLLVASGAGPVNIPAGVNQTVPIALYVPLTEAGTSLLTENQNLSWNVWGNASYAYLFSVSVDISTQRSWGAPFDALNATVGTPLIVNGSEAIPVTLSFSNDASFTVAGAIDFQVVPASGPNCAQGSFVLNVPSGSPFAQTDNVALRSGCDPSGGHVNAQFVGSGFTVSLPSEPIP